MIIDESTEDNFFHLSEMYPLCLEDATDIELPKSYKTLISNFAEDELNANVICISMLFLLAAESGFLPYTVDNVPLDQRYYFFNFENINRACADFHISSHATENEYRFTLYLGASENLRCLLIIKLVTGLLVVNIFAANHPICFSKIFTPDSLISCNKLNVTFVKQWCTDCKNDLLYPMKVHMLKEACIKNASLIDLPNEVLIDLAKYLNIKDFLNLCVTCKHMKHNLDECGSIWKYYCRIHEFDMNKQNDISWKDYFRMQINLKNSNEKRNINPYRYVWDFS